MELPYILHKWYTRNERELLLQRTPEHLGTTALSVGTHIIGPPEGARCPESMHTKRREG